MTAGDYIHYLQLLPHPEGGYYKETYRSGEWIEQHALAVRFTGKRSFSTAIYYLIKKGDYSGLH